MTKETIENQEVEQKETKQAEEQTEQLITMTEAFAEYGELSSRFDSLSDEEKERLGYLYNFFLDTIDSVGDLYNQVMTVADVLGDFLREKEIYEEFTEYYPTEIRKRLGIAEGIQ